MTDSAAPQRPDPGSALARLASAGVVRLPEDSLEAVLRRRGALDGPITDAGSRAVAEQRGERD